jgi:hypothetical protein
MLIRDMLLSKLANHIRLEKMSDVNNKSNLNLKFFEQTRHISTPTSLHP